jgi:glycine/D-amino acid oxidase-like deaminating enzyme
MTRLDYLIVGQGLAGTMLAWMLFKRGKNVHVIDHYNPNSSSRVAAGLYNPITGRRFVKTWMADVLFPFAESTYREIEQKTGQRFCFQRRIIRRVADEAEKREVMRKKEKTGYAPYLHPLQESDQQFRLEIRHGGHVDVRLLLESVKELLDEEVVFIKSKIGYQDIKLREDGIVWENYTAKRVVFCEGYMAMGNPWFSWLPFTHAKGEILTIEAPRLKQDYILSSGIFILPIGNDRYWVGSTYDWDDLSESPTEKGKNELKEKLDRLIDCEYVLIDQQAGIRPTVRDRRPLMGTHPDYPQLAIFNGLGTKGVSLAPYFANHLVEHLEDQKPLLPEVDIRRFI